MTSTSVDFRELTVDEISEVNGGILPAVLLPWALCGLIVAVETAAVIEAPMVVGVTLGMIGLVVATAKYGFEAGKTQGERDNRADGRGGCVGGK